MIHVRVTESVFLLFGAVGDLCRHAWSVYIFKIFE